MSFVFSVNDITGRAFSFNSLNELKVFFTAELSAWEELITDISTASLSDHITKISLLSNFVTTLQKISEPVTPSQVNNTNTVKAFKQSGQWLYSKHPFIETYLHIIKQYGKHAANSFFAVISGSNINIQNSPNSFKGLFLAMKYLDYTGDFDFDISNSKSYDEILDDFENSRNTLFSSTNETITDLKESKDNLIESVDIVKSDLSTGVATVIGNHKKEFTDLIDNSTKAIDSYKETLKEQAKLKSPAMEWSKRAIHLRIRGYLFGAALTLLIFNGIELFSDIFLTWLSGKKIPFDLKSLQGVVLFATVISIYAFFIRFLSKLSLSAFHLAHDAEERSHLTHVYYAMTNDSKIDDSERALVLQSLFSRSDSGLLNIEQSQTLPNLTTRLNID